jgi:hypothetical protein
VDFTPKPVVSPGDYSGTTVTTRSPLNLSVDYAEPMTPLTSAVAPVGTVTLDLHNTMIYDNSDGEPRIGPLSTLVKRINEEGKLVLDGDALIAADDVEKPFDFKYDEEGDTLGAGTAFLQD